MGLILSLYAVVTSAQTPPSPSIKVNVREVLVPVVVTDKSGHYVTDLTAADFQVLEDGTPQKIVAFRNNVAPGSMPAAEAPQHAPARPPNVAASAPDAQAATLNASPKRTFLICVDTLHSAFDSFARVRTALKKLFEEEQPGDSQYALISLGWAPHVIVDSTRDPQTILNAIGSKAFLKTIQDSEAANIASSIHQFVELMRAYCSACACGPVSTDGPKCSLYRGQVQLFLLSYAERASTQNQNFLSQLNRLISAIASMPTSRTVVFLSDGFNRFPGQELEGILKGFEVRDRSFRFNPRDLQPQLDEVLRHAVRYDVRFYTLDSRGLYTSPDIPGTGEDASFGSPPPPSLVRESMFVANENGDAMAELARETGGLFFENTNDLLKGIRRAFADGREGYTLAYIPTNTLMDGKFRKITVEAKGQKLHVASKTGYWATPQ